MTLLDLMLKVLEQQGIVALILFISMLQQNSIKKQLLNKNCEMVHYMMKCLDREFERDHVVRESSPGLSKPSNFDDLLPEDTFSSVR